MGKMLLLLLLVTNMAFSNRIKGFGTNDIGGLDDAPTNELVDEYNNYDIERLNHLSDSLLNGIIDTTLGIQDMVMKFIATSNINGDVKLGFKVLDKSIGGYYNFTDSTMVINTLYTDREVVLYILIHELTHSIQDNYDFYTRGRKTVIINELFADLIASNKTGVSKYRQNFIILYGYVDKFFEPSRVLKAKMGTIINLFNAVTNQLK